MLPGREEEGQPLRRFWGHIQFCFPALWILLASCAAGQIRHGTYFNEAKGFVVQLPSEAWDVEMGKEPDLLLRHRSRQAGIVVNATCGEIPTDRPLKIVVRHLFFGIQAKEILLQGHEMANQGDGLEMVLRGILGGRELLLHGYTLKGSDCVYDLVLFAPSESYSEVNGEFESFVQRFHRLRERAR